MRKKYRIFKYRLNSLLPWQLLVWNRHLDRYIKVGSYETWQDAIDELTALETEKKSYSLNSLRRKQ